MLTPDARIARIAERQHGAFSRAQARACGLSGDQIDRRVASGRWRRIHRGVYSVAGSRLAFEGQVMAAVLAVGKDAVAGGVTAGKLWELDGIRSPRVHVVVPINRRPASPAGVLVRQSRTLCREDVTSLRGVPITTVPRTLMDLAGRLAEPALEDALDSAVRRKRLDAEVFLKVVRSRRNHGVARLAVLEQLLLVRIGKEPPGSGKENRLRRFIESSGLPVPVGQHKVWRDDGSFVARVDFAYPHAKVFLEFDSYEHHSSRNDWEDDLVRQNELVELGWLPIRITDRQLDNVPEDIVRIIWRRLTAAGAAGPRHIEGATQVSSVDRG